MSVHSRQRAHNSESKQTELKSSLKIEVLSSLIMTLRNGPPVLTIHFQGTQKLLLFLVKGILTSLSLLLQSFPY